MPTLPSLAQFCLLSAMVSELLPTFELSMNGKKFFFNYLALKSAIAGLAEERKKEKVISTLSAHLLIISINRNEKLIILRPNGKSMRLKTTICVLHKSLPLTWHVEFNKDPLLNVISLF
jgi:hypothetical protein